MKKKIIILIINKHIGEIDWILPLLYKVKNKYKFITIFNNEEIFSSLTKNKSLFLLLKDINQDYFILKKRNDLTFFLTDNFKSSLVPITFGKIVSIGFL